MMKKACAHCAYAFLVWRVEVGEWRVELRGAKRRIVMLWDMTVALGGS